MLHLPFCSVFQENLQTLGAEIEKLIKQQRDPEDGVRRKWHDRLTGPRTIWGPLFVFVFLHAWRMSWMSKCQQPVSWRSTQTLFLSIWGKTSYLNLLEWSLFHPYCKNSLYFLPLTQRIFLWLTSGSPPPSRATPRRLLTPVASSLKLLIAL